MWAQTIEDTEDPEKQNPQAGMEKTKNRRNIENQENASESCRSDFRKTDSTANEHAFETQRMSDVPCQMPATLKTTSAGKT